jgi:hypothetical protein
MDEDKKKFVHLPNSKFFLKTSIQGLLKKENSIFADY